MMRVVISSLFFLLASTSFGQDIKVEYDKDRDLTIYKTFTMGEGEIITPKDQRTIADQQLHKWVHEAIVTELKAKGLSELDTLGDLTASYIVGSVALTDVQNLGPMGVSPQSSEHIWSRDYRQGNLVIDLNDRSNILVWRVNATTSYGTPGTDRVVQNIVANGFKKFSTKPKKGKKRKG
jgi:hypothetical protein